MSERDETDENADDNGADASEEPETAPGANEEAAGGESAPQEADPAEEAKAASEGAATEDAQAASAEEQVEGEPEPEPEPDPLAELQALYDEAQARLRTVSKAYTDLQKEMAAFRERMEARSKVNSELQAFDYARRFFDPVMNLKRSLQQPGDDVESLKEGLLMVQRQFMVAMEKLGLEEVPGEGATFDPNIHEALAVTPVADASQDGKVLMVHTAGFTVRGKVLQAAQVVIAKHQEPAGEA